MQKKTNVMLVTIAIFVASFMSAVEGTIVSTAMPTIIGDLRGMNLMNWVFSIFLLTNAMVTPIYGKLADRVGRKPIFLIGLVIFVVGSSLCGFATNMVTLIASRALQGIGAGAIMPVSFTIIADIYPFEKRAKVLGLNGSAWGIASIIAPLLGGFIVEKLSWHWIFFINVPIGLLTIVMISVFLHEDKRHSKAPVDYLGSLFLMATLLFVMYGFQVLEKTPINWFEFLGLILGAVASFALFIWQENRASDPIISLELFKNPTFDVQNAVAALVSGFLIGFEVYIPMWMQGVLGMPASMGGFAVTPSSVMWVVGSFVAGHLIAKYSPKKILTVSLTLILIGCVLLIMAPITTQFWQFLLIAMVLGTGFGITITTTTVFAQNSVPKEQLGVATSFNTLSRTLGQTLMVSIYGIIMNIQTARGIAAHPQATEKMMNQLINPQTAKSLPQHLLPMLHNVLYQGLHHIYLASLVVLILALLINLIGDRRKKILA